MNAPCRKAPAILAFLLLAVALAGRGRSAEVSWTLPATYTDNTEIDNAVIATIVVYVYHGTDNATWTEVHGGVSDPGVTSWRGTIPRNVWKYYSARAVIPADNAWSEYSPGFYACPPSGAAYGGTVSGGVVR